MFHVLEVQMGLLLYWQRAEQHLLRIYGHHLEEQMLQQQAEQMEITLVQLPMPTVALQLAVLLLRNHQHYLIHLL